MKSIVNEQSLKIQKKFKASKRDILEFVNNPIYRQLRDMLLSVQDTTSLAFPYCLDITSNWGDDEHESSFDISLCKNIESCYDEEGAIRNVISYLLGYVYSLNRTKIVESIKAINLAEVLNDEILHDKEVNENCEILYDFLYDRTDENIAIAIHQEYCKEFRIYKKSKLAETWRNYTRNNRKPYIIPKFLCEAIINLNYDCIDNVDIDESKLPEGMTKEMAIDCLKKAANHKNEDSK